MGWAMRWPLPGELAGGVCRGQGGVRLLTSPGPQRSDDAGAVYKVEALLPFTSEMDQAGLRAALGC